jgi:hypothetical protein
VTGNGGVASFPSPVAYVYIRVLHLKTKQTQKKAHNNKQQTNKQKTSNRQ